MLRVISYASKLLIAAGLVAGGLVGFSGTAEAGPTCWGWISGGWAHRPFTNSSSDTAGCTHQQDWSDTSMPDLAGAGSFPGGSSEISASPWTQVP
jgi:hypothetical protein